jgi:hypothetical protein
VRDDAARLEVERRQQLGGVEHAEAPRGAGAEVVHGAATAEPLGGEVDDVGELRKDRRDGVDGHAVLLVQQAQHVDGRECIESGGCLEPQFGRRQQVVAVVLAVEESVLRGHRAGASFESWGFCETQYVQKCRVLEVLRLFFSL